MSVNIFIFMVTKAAVRKALILQAPRPLPSSGDRVVRADPRVPSPTPKLQAAAHAAGPQEAVGCEAGLHGHRGWPWGCRHCVSQPAGFLPSWVVMKGREDPEMVLGAGRGPGAGAERGPRPPSGSGVALLISTGGGGGSAGRRPENITDREVVYSKADAQRSKDFHIPGQNG